MEDFTTLYWKLMVYENQILIKPIEDLNSRINNCDYDFVCLVCRIWLSTDKKHAFQAQMEYA